MAGNTVWWSVDPDLGTDRNHVPAVPIYTRKRSFAIFEASPYPTGSIPSILSSKFLTSSGIGAKFCAQVKLPARTDSLASVSSVYSGSTDGSSQSLSDISTNTKDSLSGIDPEVGLGPTPSLPPADKDALIQEAGEESRPAKRSASNSISSLNSQKKEAIWRRRSLRRSDSSIVIVFEDLQLTKSNGSTTASPPKRQEQASKSQVPIPLSITTNRKPAPFLANRPAPPQPDLMGSKVSRLRKKGSVEGNIGSKDGGLQGPDRKPPPQQYPAGPGPGPGPRLSMQDYARKGKQQPSTPSAPSPVSPLTPPDDGPPVLPSISESRSQNSSQYSSSEATIVAPNIAPIASMALLSKENLNPSYGHSRDISEALTIDSQPTARSPKLQKPQATRRILSPDPPPTSPPMSITSPRQSMTSPLGRAQYFPTIQSPASPGFIFPGPPLDLVHFDCYHSHRLMRRTTNGKCPVACMICQGKDTRDRWRCMWCYLGACGSCMQVLSQIPGRDLRVCLEQLENRHV
ncbi:hypothetical protein LZ554_006227 [Drepanopeziza brunnea f. sp. 'monogermtubi']|nr:hypothetical protein LZ554_006227 [Drepanopeziza brunnea f. sp. 'monogermtubi']